MGRHAAGSDILCHIGNSPSRLCCSRILPIQFRRRFWHADGLYCIQISLFIQSSSFLSAFSHPPSYIFLHKVCWYQDIRHLPASLLLPAKIPDSLQSLVSCPQQHSPIPGHHVDRTDSATPQPIDQLHPPSQSFPCSLSVWSEV